MDEIFYQLYLVEGERRTLMDTANAFESILWFVGGYEESCGPQTWAVDMVDTDRHDVYTVTFTGVTVGRVPTG